MFVQFGLVGSQAGLHLVLDDVSERWFNKKADTGYLACC